MPDRGYTLWGTPHSLFTGKARSCLLKKRVPFTELVHIGEECARHGVKAIQLVGWNDGGQDQGKNAEQQRHDV